MPTTTPQHKETLNALVAALTDIQGAEVGPVVHDGSNEGPVILTFSVDTLETLTYVVEAAFAVKPVDETSPETLFTVYARPRADAAPAIYFVLQSHRCGYDALADTRRLIDYLKAVAHFRDLKTLDMLDEVAA